VLFFDTTSTYFETEGEDEPVLRDDHGMALTGGNAGICWLALLLARIAENACKQTWPELRRDLDRIHVGTFTGPAGTFQQRTELPKRQRDILKALQIEPPPRIYQLKLHAEP
jgi:hypothetical protein